MAENPDPTGELHPHTVFGVWAEPLLDGRRIAILGDASTGLPGRLATRSGRRVHAYDPNPERLAFAIAQRVSGVGFGSIEEAFDAHDGGFDAVIVPDLTAFTDGPALVERAAALLSPRGVLLLGSPHESSGAGGPSYYELYDLVSAQLDEVRMLGVAPFVGFTLADFAAAGEPAVTVDSTLSVPEEPLHYLAVASQSAREVEAYTLMQVPTAAGMLWLSGLVATPGEESEAPPESFTMEDGLDDGPDPSEALREEMAQITRARERAVKEVTHLEGQLAKRAALVTELQAALEGQDEKRAALEADLDGLRGKRNALETELEGLRAKDSSRMAALEADLEGQLVERSARIKELETELGKLRDRMSKRAHDAERRAEQAEQRAAKGEGRVAKVERELEASRSEYDRARQALEESHQIDLDRMLDRIAELEAEAEAVQSDEAPTQRVTDEPPPASAPTARGLQFQIDELTKALREARRERDEEKRRSRDLSRKLERADRAAQEAADKAAAERKAPPRDDRAEKELADDLSRLENRLRERGRIVAELDSQVRESRRVGIEMLRDLLAARQANGAEPSGAEAELERLRGETAKQQADLEAAAWRIRSLEEGQAPAEASDDLAKLEQALAASRQEVADLRRKLIEDRG